MKKRIFYFLIILVIPLSAYLFWPLSSDHWEINFDGEKIAAKKTFLNNYKKKDSVRHPNVLLIVVDDLGMADLSLYGVGKPQTPNIDRLGAGGTVFTNAYVTSPVCSPSRAAILTGRYPQRYGFEYQLHNRYLRNRMEYLGFTYFIDSYPWVPKWMDEVPDKKNIDKQGLPPSEILLPELLKAKGYQTAIIGKWHLGADEAQLPCNLGFDFQYGFYASHSLYAYEKTEGIHDQKIENDFTDPHIWSGQREGIHAIYENCEEIKVSEYLTDRFADEASEYLLARKDNPFFLYLSFNAPHTPLQAPVSYMEKFREVEDPIKRTYYAMIANLDDNIGKVLKALRESGHEENTMIFFISDNGGAEYTFTTDNGPYKGGKITDLEGGLKVPFIISMKNKVPMQMYTDMVSSMDIFRTIADNTGITLPDDRIYDGVNLLPYINREISSKPHDYLYWQRGFSKTIRSQDRKLFINEEAGDTVLFDMVADPYEHMDISQNEPETVRKMAQAHQGWSADFPPPLWPGMIYYEFKDGNRTFCFDQ